MTYRRSTGTWTDVLRRAWAELGRRPRLRGINRWGHRAYDGWEHLRYAASLTADPGSFARYLRLARRREPGPVRVRVKPLGGATMALRPGTTDAVSLRDTFRDRVHVPPPELEPDRIRHIVDLGVNIGATMAHNAVLHPGARIVGVELDPRTAELARRNLAPWADRCQVLQGAVWVADGEVVLAGDREDGFQAVDPATAPPGAARTRALSMETILQQLPAGARVDYLKMDVEGVEARLLSGAAAAWAARVGAISLQVHEPYSVSDCARDLRALGFVTRVDPRRPNYIVGLREEMPA